MRRIHAISIMMLMLMTLAHGQETAKDFFYTGVALYDQGKIDEAIKAYDEAIVLNPNYTEAWNGKSVALISQGKYAEAMQACNKSIGFNQSFSEPWNNKGWALNSQGKYTEAMQACDKAIELDPNICRGLR